MLSACERFGYRPYPGECLRELEPGQVAVLIAYAQHRERDERAGAA